MKVAQTVADQIESLRVEMEAKSAQYFELARKVVEDAFSKYVAPIYAAFDGKFTGWALSRVHKDKPGHYDNSRIKRGAILGWNKI